MVSPTAAFSVTIRVRLDNIPGTLGRLAAAIGEVGGNIVALEGFDARDTYLDEDLIVNCSSEEHIEVVCNALRNLDGVEVPQTAITLDGNPPMEASLFHAAKGGYRVFCEGGNDGVIAFAHESLDIVQNRLLVMVLQALPFLITGVALFYGGKYAAARIRPESRRPVIPS